MCSSDLEGILSVEQSWDSPDIYERGLNLSNQMLGGKIGSDHKENLLNVLIALRKNVALLGEESKVQRVSSELVQHIKRIRELGS